MGLHFLTTAKWQKDNEDYYMWVTNVNVSNKWKTREMGLRIQCPYTGHFSKLHADFNPWYNIAITDFFSAVKVTWPTGAPFHIYFT
jgi:hypothetical protein